MCGRDNSKHNKKMAEMAVSAAGRRHYLLDLYAETDIFKIFPVLDKRSCKWIYSICTVCCYYPDSSICFVQKNEGKRRYKERKWKVSMDKKGNHSVVSNIGRLWGYDIFYKLKQNVRFLPAGIFEVLNSGPVYFTRLKKIIKFLKIGD